MESDRTADSKRASVHPPYGRGPAPHRAYREGPYHREQRLAPDTGTILDHTPRN